MTPRRLSRAALAAPAALAALWLAGCAGEGAGPSPQKRESYFEVVKTYAAPGKGMVDLTYAGGSIWLADADRAGLIYRLEPTTGSVLSSAGTSYGPPSAICSDGAYLYVAAADTGDVWRHKLSGRMEELEHFPTGLADIRGMFYRDAHFYLFDQETCGIYEFDRDWQPGASWRVGEGEERIRGMTYADGRVWSADHRGGWLNRHWKNSYDVERKFCTPGWHPAGLAWDGGYLFLGDAAAKRISKLDISTAP